MLKCKQQCALLSPIFLNARTMTRKSHVLLCILKTRAGKNLTGSTRLMVPDHNAESIEFLFSERLGWKNPKSLKPQSLFRWSVHYSIKLCRVFLR